MKFVYHVLSLLLSNQLCLKKKMSEKYQFSEISDFLIFNVFQSYPFK